MDARLLAFIVVLTIATGAVWLKLTRIILRGEWPPMRLPLRPPGRSPGATHHQPSEHPGAAS